ncbi:MAG TPA: 2Fe-2S iron-sulfur cluster-binding protein, partial [Ktedonobacteraceae bacterium]|nr:2Fe-2S iron-sulfur cluster-binding protein [Ktedonobacteraceae bacterium]
MRDLISLQVNGQRYELAVLPHHTLLEVLREDLGLTGTKHGCELGECGACTVLIDGVPVLACLTLPVEVQNGEITTIEGLESNGKLHPLQETFAELGAAQC